MAEIHNYTMNFSFGHPIAEQLGLTSLRELACTEIHSLLPLAHINNVSEML